MSSFQPKPLSTPSPRVERRSGVDRRKVDKGPPDGRERRRGIEPRKPEVIERDPTPSEWATLQEIVSTPATPSTPQPPAKPKP